MRNRVLTAVMVCLLVFAAASSSMAVGKYVLAFWREMSCTEVGGCGGGGGTHYMRVWVFNEQGVAMPNVQIQTVGGVEVGRTQWDGARVDIPIDVNNSAYELKCVDANGSLSDVTPVMTSRRWPNWGHYSYEVGFMYKSDQTNSGTFDSTISGTVNTPTDYDNDAPCTRSLAYYYVNPLNWYSGAWDYGTWGEHGQTFIANGDRVMMVEFHGIMPANGIVDWYVEIRDGGPNGAVIASKYCPQHYSQDPWCISFPANGTGSCPVVPGRTYFARFYRSGGMNAYYANSNNYTGGQAYWRPDSSSAWQPAAKPDLVGHITCMTIGGTVGQISGTVSSGGTGINDALVTLNPGQANEVTVRSLSDGSYQFPNLSPGTYTVTAWKPGYSRSTQGNIQVNGGLTTTQNFSLNSLVNLLTNPGLETADFTGWTRWGDSLSIYGPVEWAIFSYEGRKFAAYVTSWGYNKNGGMYQRLTNLIPGLEYTFSSYIYTHSWTDSPANAFPANCQNRLGVDLTGGTSPTSANVQWTPWTDSNDKWTPIWLKRTATGSAATVFLQFKVSDSREWNKNAFDAVYVTTEQQNVSITSGPSAVNITPTSAKISWTTDVPSTSRVDYGPTTSYGSSAADSSLVTSHTVTITGLTPGTVCNYKVTSTASGYLDGVSSNKTFTVPANNGSIGSVKALSDGTAVGLVGKIVTAGADQMSGCFYIEELDRSSGIRVYSSESVAVGDTVSVSGTLATVNGERVIQATGVSE